MKNYNIVPNISIRLTLEVYRQMKNYLRNNPTVSRNRLITEALKSYLTDKSNP